MKIDRKELAAMLVYISDWCIEHRLGTGMIHNPPEEGLTDGIFVNGNYARVLICTYEITGEQTYLNEAISWCDYFVNAANPVKTSRGNDAVWWWDIHNNNLYLADTGTAIHALFKAFPYVDAARQQKYLDACHWICWPCLCQLSLSRAGSSASNRPGSALQLSCG